ncbi:MAG: hypothetical protein ACP5HJ_03315 [Candidatus Micrarchaeia archaeon]
MAIGKIIYGIIMLGIFVGLIGAFFYSYTNVNRLSPPFSLPSNQSLLALNKTQSISPFNALDFLTNLWPNIVNGWNFYISTLNILMGYIGINLSYLQAQFLGILFIIFLLTIVSAIFIFPLW